MATDNWAGLDEDAQAFLNEALSGSNLSVSNHGSSDHGSSTPDPTTVSDLMDRVPTVQSSQAPQGQPLSQPDLSLTTLLGIAIQAGASDLHVGAGVAPHLRVKGELRPIRSVPTLDGLALEQLLLSPLTPEQRNSLTKDGDLDLAIQWQGEDGREQRFRASIFRQSGTLAGAFRVVAQEIPTLDQLGLPPAVKRFADLTQGLVLVTGRTGSGKSTTLASMIQRINQAKSVHIVTIEDPIEYRYRPINSVIRQREVGVDTSSFSSALRHALRQDPDVILIGELRDLDTIRTALTAAETGHLVLATLHSSNTSGAITRMIDVFPGDQQPQIRSQLALSLEGIVSQDLIRTQDGDLAPATEILVANAAVRNTIREDKLHQVQSLLETGSDEGMHTFDQSLASLLRSGRINSSTAVGASRDPANLAALVSS